MMFRPFFHVKDHTLVRRGLTRGWLAVGGAQEALSSLCLTLHAMSIISSIQLPPPSLLRRHKTRKYAAESAFQATSTSRMVPWFVRCLCERKQLTITASFYAMQISMLDS
ncbi:hypothetical protein TEQG_00037 [Trichophyton equinum CBS 127.97]|uniref:Uncharacterized protein n=1 Tax=Trichophyton equinum (strain ATCC MYA-4606 / CBS 127.97) TaxID=559882 RepID=F2PGG4_TRIEC|nr:hypothetical protein TEQG_00037 [Trichophyton equinum CBS 127.97]